MQVAASIMCVYGQRRRIGFSRIPLQQKACIYIAMLPCRTAFPYKHADFKQTIHHCDDAIPIFITIIYILTLFS